MVYRAFISYSHAADARLAQAVRSALHRFAKPWYRLRAVRVFCDTTSLSASPGLWPAIEETLRESEWLLLMASPQSAQSRWVQMEVDWWLAHRSSERMLVLLTEGDIRWDAAAGDFDWTRTTALPTTLKARIAQEPLYVDLRWTRQERTLSLRQPRFRAVVLDVAAPLHGRSKDELDGEDVRQHRITRGAVTVGVAAIVCFAALAGWQWRVAAQQRDEARRQAGIARSAQAHAEDEQKKAERERDRAERAAAAERAAKENEERQRREAERQRAIAVEEAQRALAGKLTAESRQRQYRKPDLALLLAVQALMFARTPEADDTLLSILSSYRRLVAYLRPDVGEPSRIDVSADGRHLAVLGTRQMQVWDIDRRAPIAPPYARPGFDIAYTRTSGHVVVLVYAPGYFLHAVDARTGRKLASSPRVAGVDEPRPRAIAGIPDADTDRVVLERENGAIEVWDLLDGTFRRLRPPDLTEQDSERATAALRARKEMRTLDGAWRVSASRYDGVAFLVDTSEQEPVREALHGHELGVPGAAFDPRGRFVATAGTEGNVLIWRLHGSVLARRTIDVPFFPRRLTFTRQGSLFVGGDESRWALYDAHGKMLVAAPSKQGEWRSGSPAVSNGGGMVAERSSFIHVQLRSTTNGAPIGAPFVGKKDWAPHLIAFSPDDRLMAAGGRDNDVMLWNLTSGDLVANAIKGHSGGYLHGLHTFAFSPDSRLLATGGRDAKIFLWDTATGKPVGDPLLGHKGAIEAVAFSHDGRLLAAGGEVDRVTLYDLRTRKPLERRLSATNVGVVTRLEFSPHGDLLVGAGHRQVTVWRLDTSEPVLELNDGAREVAFSRDGTQLAMPAGQNTVTIYELDASQLAGTVCDVVQRNLTCEEWIRHVGDRPYRKVCAMLPGPPACTAASRVSR